MRHLPAPAPALACLLLSLAVPALADPVDPAAYFPLSDGATWTYDTELGPVTVQIQPGTVNVGGVLTKERRSIAGDEVGSGEFWTNADGIRRHRDFDATEGLTIDYTPPLLFAANPSDVGSMQSSNGTIVVSDGSGSVDGTYSLQTEITAMGPMDTPAGFFCDVYVSSETFSITALGETFSLTETDYLVRGLGVVAVDGFDDGPYFATLTSSSLPFPPPDADCDGTPDAADLCPFYAETDPAADTDGNGIGNECECGDQTGDGRVTIEDILAINGVIFGLQPAAELCDANCDGQCNIADILGANAKIFGTPACCARFPLP